MTIHLNADDLFVDASNNTENNTFSFLLGNGNNDTVLCEGTFNATITLGSGAGDTVSFFGVGDGEGDANNTITFGNGDGDKFLTGGLETSFNIITFGDGTGDMVLLASIGNESSTASTYDTFTLGDGNNDIVDARISNNDTIILGNGNKDTVIGGFQSTIIVGNGNDTIHVGMDNNVTVGTGKDSFVFDQITAGNIGAVTINHFDPSKDVIVIQKALATSVSEQDVGANVVVTVAPGDTITLVGVHSSDLHASDFHFV